MSLTLNANNIHSEFYDEKTERENLERAKEKELRESELLHPDGPLIPVGFIDYNRMIGNPFSHVTGKYQDMTPYQVNYDTTINLFHLVLNLKSRKIGATDSVNRSNTKNQFARYRGHDVVYMAGNIITTTKEILIRVDEMFHDKRHEDGTYAFKDLEGVTWKYKEIIKRASLQSQHPIIEFTNDTRFFGFAASRQGKSQPIRGPDDIISIFLTEAGHTGMNDDQPIMDAAFPNIAQRSDADFIQETTGNGKRGFYYSYWQAMMKILCQLLDKPLTWAQATLEHDHHQDLCDLLWENRMKIGKKVVWFPLMTDYTKALKHKVISPSYIRKAKADPNLDFKQEHCCKFTSTLLAAFEPLTEENFLKDDEKALNLKEMLNE